MRRSPATLFAVDYRNVPGKGVVVSGGLRFQKEESALRQEYADAVEGAGLETLLGEASLWVLWPSTVAIWAFLPLFWKLRADLAVLATIGLFLAVQVVHMLFYSRALNYVLLVLGNRALQVTAYIGWAVVIWRAAGVAKALALLVWLLLMSLGVLQVVFVVPFVPLLARVFPLRPADQALRNVARSYTRWAGHSPPR